MFTAIRERAKKIHEDVNQMYDDKPYIYHLDMVHWFMSEYLWYFDKEVWGILTFGAYFHDTIEDARLTYNDVMKIAKEFFDDEDARVATEIVYACTNEKGRNRDERANDKYYLGIRCTRYAPFIKMCDRMANMAYSRAKQSSMAKKYEKEMPHFLESIGAKGTYEEIIDFDFERAYHVPPKMVDDALRGGDTSFLLPIIAHYEDAKECRCLHYTEVEKKMDSNSSMKYYTCEKGIDDCLGCVLFKEKI